MRVALSAPFMLKAMSVVAAKQVSRVVMRG